jgi:hypothetical protein
MNLSFRKLVTVILAMVLVPCLAAAEGVSAPDVPEAIKAPAGEVVVLQAHAIGIQIYTCGSGADGKAQWTLKAPDAVLHDKKGAVIGHHFAGPAWKLKDGSEVTGKAAARADSPDPNSIPWLLVNVSGHTGKGKLARVTSIQRVHTQGGQPPSTTGCDGAKPGAEAKIRYAADYYFFAPAK